MEINLYPQKYPQFIFRLKKYCCFYYLLTKNYLLDNKQKIRDILIQAALQRIDDTDGNHEMRNVQRVFEKMAKESWSFWVGMLSIR